jgi:hypothetical protein
MSAEKARVALARWLLDAGAGHSARNVLGAMRGADANRIRIAAQDVRLRPGIYCLVTLPDGTGAVLPLRPTPGHPRADDRSFRDACVTAHAQVRAILKDRSLPMLRFELEEELAVFGPSVGLPAALAFLAHFAPARAPTVAVLATGGLLADGRVTQVAQLDAKHAIALQEGAGAIIFPSGEGSWPGVVHASTFAEAARVVFGDRPLGLDVARSDVDVSIHRARTLSTTAEGIALLASLDHAALTPADRARVFFDLGSFHRNLGQCHEAWRLHREARALLETERQVIGGEAAERYELECWATELDQFHLADAVAGLRERLGRPFLKLRNELRCRGMLAQGVAMGGRFAEAVAIRSANLALHERSDALSLVRPATLCHLALDASLAGDAATFETSIEALRTATRPGDETQWRFNATVMVRGLVALGRHETALQWSRDEISVFDCRAPATLILAAAGHAPVVSAPELTALRALVRASRRLGRTDEAIVLGTRAVLAAGEPTELFGWMAALLRLELALAQHDRGDHDAAEAATRDAQARLSRLHAEATAFHAPLLSASATEREAALDRVWY